ncbi:MAG: sigma-54 dependent transcriptional regulator [Gemmatimonadota bacterium]
MAETLSVLILDDEPLAREALIQCLAGEPHDVRAVGTVREATGLLNREVFDVAFVDMRLEEGSGIDHIPEFLETAPWLRIVLMTAHRSIESAVQAVRAGAVDYLSKPFDAAEVRALTAKLVAARRRERRLEARRSRDSDHLPPVLESGNPAMRRTLELARQVAESDATLLLTGESGTGKGVLARAIHRWSARSEEPFATINCPALSKDLLMSELFGHVKGAFTGAVKTQPGRIETTEGGTLFLDEVAELPPEIQPRLLRFLQDREYERVGDPRTRQADVRLMAATNQDLRQAVREGSFREDLYYRLNVIEIHVPPLREHPEDILPLAREFLYGFAREYNRGVRGFSTDAERRLRSYVWPGNIRELENAVQRAVILCQGSEVGAELLPGPMGEMEAELLHGEGADLASLDEMEANYIRHVLEVTDTVEEAADVLGISATTLWRRRKKHEI